MLKLIKLQPLLSVASPENKVRGAQQEFFFSFPARDFFFSFPARDFFLVPRRF